MKRQLTLSACASILAVLIANCSGLYYATMEKFGKEKREILVDRVSDIRKRQENAKEQFKTTLEAFQEVTGFQGGELEKAYNKLNREYERSADRAEGVRDRIRSIEKVARDLFREWQAEIGQISDPQLQAASEQLRQDTEERYETFAVKLRQTEAKMDPVLKAFQDQVLFLKHNLNAQAIDSLKETVLEVRGDVAELVTQIEESIQEADAFIAAMS